MALSSCLKLLGWCEKPEAWMKVEENRILVTGFGSPH